MDTEQQIRLNFLDEAQEYFDRMESSSIGLADAAVDPQKVDLLLRSAHSIKGGAAMMKFDTLSRVAHRLEDFLKVLRVRYAGASVGVEVETALLQSVDCLRDLASQNRQGIEVNDSEISDRTEPIFDLLKQHLGELEDADENALLSQDEDIDPAVLIFEEGVDGVLDRFETQLQELRIDELAREITSTAQELIGFGMMADLDSFTQLCQSILQKAASISPSEITPLAEQALKTWRRSHALVIRGSTDKLPVDLENEVFTDTNAAIEPDGDSTEDLLESLESLELDTLQSAFEFDPQEELEPVLDSPELSSLQSAFEIDPPEDFDSVELDSAQLNQLQSAFEVDPPEELESVELDSAQLNQLQSAFEVDPPEPTPVKQPLPSAKELPTVSTTPAPSIDKMVRVPVSQLQQFNNLFEQLVLNRNSINLRLQQFQNIVFLMSQRISQMENSNTQLKKWYDRASVEGFLSQTQPSESQDHLKSDRSLTKPRQNGDNGFDSLEMDRYTDIHLICQEQIETIVQLQEVATDIKLGIQDIDSSVKDLNYTTKSMQGNVTRTQMLPFSETVKRFPRVIRDLNLQFDKQVNLKIVGEATLLDRSVIEALSDPLMHLLRNAFDHGIEDSATRIAAGKPEVGTITLRATTQGTYSIITLSDDGAGIPIDKIRDRVVKMGFSHSQAVSIPEAELLEFIFEPGFSTAKQVTELSGRGVGMDVVKTNLKEVKGDVKVATEPGKGTTFTIKIPFTLSILKVAIIERAGIIFAIPANSIRELVPLSEAMQTGNKVSPVSEGDDGASAPCLGEGLSPGVSPGVYMPRGLPHERHRGARSEAAKSSQEDDLGIRPALKVPSGRWRECAVQESVNTSENIQHLSWNQQEIPLVEIEKTLSYRRAVKNVALTGSPAIDRTMALVIKDEKSFAALQIDRFWHEQESTVRSIDSPLPLPPGVVSSIVFGDGKVIPLVDPILLIEKCLSTTIELDRYDAIEPEQTSATTILVVDDSINIRRYLSLTLEKAGYRVEQAKDGREAVDRLLGGLAVDGVICDIEMPKLDGYGVLEEIKERPEFANLPIAMLTSRSNEKHRKVAMNLGASAYFSKPYNEQELLNELAILVNK